ncbi:phage tail protein [Thalassospira sp. UBA1131]|uniref:phage tail protein n=1 Tax=Thalassospira sp. UBA1131 TaxID=1947672 RepID=UPI0025D9237D|nr:phage tail protein [Thalassospira sp. UBA1131]
MCNKITICTEFDAVQIAGLQVPIASIHAFATQTVPADYLICDGSAVSRADYAELFAALGTVWGEGDGTTTFNIPDLRGEFLRGFDAGRGVDGGRVFASDQGDQMQQITGSIGVVSRFNSPEGVFSYTTQSGTTDATSGITNQNRLHFDSADSPNARVGDETRPRNVAVTYAIKATVPAAA